MPTREYAAHINSLPSAWVSRRMRIDAAPIEFFAKDNPRRYRPWLAGILDDVHPCKVTLKSRQIGISALAVMEELWLATTMGGVNIMHSFPRGKQVTDFSQSRFDVSVNASRWLTGVRRDPWNVGLKALQAPGLQPAFIFFRSSWDEAIGEGVNADVVIFDEYDRMKPGVEDAFTESLTSSAIGWRRYYSTPSIPGRGVAAIYDRSDMRRWEVRCPKCNHDQALEWESNIEQTRGGDDLIALVRVNPDIKIQPGTFVLVCAACRAPMPDLRELGGRWVAQRPERTDVRGYAISQLNCAWITPDEIAAKAADLSPQAWNNYVLGRAYRGAGTMLDAAAVNDIDDPSITGRSYRKDEDIVISAGIDWGEMNWVVVLARIRGELTPRLLDVAWFADTSRPLAQVEAIATYLGPLRPDVVVADFGYGQDRNPALRAKFPNFWACRYPGGTGKTSKADFMPDWNLKQRELTVDRSGALKHLAERIRLHHAFRIPQMPAEKRAMIGRHFTALSTMRHISDDGDVVEEVVRSGPDHLYHAALYATLGMDRFRTGGVSTGMIDTSGMSGAGGPIRPPMPVGSMPGRGGLFG